MYATSAHVTKRIMARLATATREEWAEGETWYARARQTISDMADGYLTTTQIAGIMAALSPQTRWDKNIEGTARMVAARRARKRLPRGCTLYRTNAVKAWAIAKGSSPESALSGIKVTPFYRNLTGDESDVTVDTWIWKGSGLTGSLTARKNRAIKMAYKVAARKLGLTPAQVQAIDWVVIRGGGN